MHFKCETAEYILFLTYLNGILMNKTGIWIIGGGGLARGAVDALESAGTHIAGLVIPNGQNAGWYNGAVVMEDDFLGSTGAASAVVAIGDNAARMAAVQRCCVMRPALAWAVVRHASALVAPTAALGEGAIVLAGAIVAPGARIGGHVVVYSGCVIEHDSVVADFASFGPGAVLGGGVHVGAGSFIGLGARIAHGRLIGSDSVIGLGSAVLHDVGDCVVAYGSPCRIVSSRRRGDPYL